MSRRNVLRSLRASIVPQGAKFNCAIAPNVGVGRAAALVLAEHPLNHLALVLAREVKRLKRDSQVRGRTERTTALLLPITEIVGADENADDVVSFSLQKRGRNRGVHSSAHSHIHLGHIRGA